MELSKEQKKSIIEPLWLAMAQRVFSLELNQDTTRAGGDEKVADDMTPEIEKQRKHRDFLEQKLAEIG